MFCVWELADHSGAPLWRGVSGVSAWRRNAGRAIVALRQTAPLVSRPSYRLVRTFKTKEEARSAKSSADRVLPIVIPKPTHKRASPARKVPRVEPTLAMWCGHPDYTRRCPRLPHYCVPPDPGVPFSVTPWRPSVAPVVVDRAVYPLAWWRLI